MYNFEQLFYYDNNILMHLTKWENMHVWWVIVILHPYSLYFYIW